MDLSTILTKLLEAPQTVPALVGALIGGTMAVAGSVMAQCLTHRFTRRREVEKLLREKAEELLKTLCQIRHTLFVWHEEIIRQANSSELRDGETPAALVARRPPI